MDWKLLDSAPLFGLIILIVGLSAIELAAYGLYRLATHLF
jgi:hypothetical protein